MHYCHICESNQSDGMFIYYLYVCESCQEKIVATDPEDPDYRVFVHKMRKMRELALKS
ncbi:MAG: sigma-G inhibitor, Gin [Amphibacillus sp.]|uniref:Inhibitor of sigma-G Gin n=1 Tax=Amphibacillus xylanus (strain ATCC 51415 / DSM 6626 / JCM 7361 / LMG 17667 / NBRC 15112 / Ep01) TaxID=698758 RepID=K0J125_AMPXN|nr:sigma factor G inhibitor Gin [Amphibacillus xylanus]NMA89978.1 sigma-G inhibitor, Gin [Amphibacillus sp.]NMA91280.1 sigma-G inhibitor, Gin [Amphibacillus sp.]BAM46161.1 hypothetical protein AXY_00290 [Amphibacillus xylanus NBRC 15112]